MTREERDRTLLGSGAAVGAAIAAFALLAYLDSHPALTGPDPPWQALAGIWTLNPELSGVPGGDRAGTSGESFDGAGTLRIETDSPLVVVSRGGNDVRSLYLGGPPLEERRGPGAGREIASWSRKGLVVSRALPAGPTFVETFRVGDDGSGRLQRTLEAPVPGAGKALARRFVYDRTGDVARSEVRPSLLAATVVVALGLVLAVERAIPGTRAP